MKKIKIATLIVCMLFLLPHISPVKANDGKYESIKNKVETIIPEGWTLQSKNNEFILSRVEDVRFYNFMSLGSLDPNGEIKYRVEKGEAKPYKIKLVITTLMDMNIYSKISKINNKIEVSKGTPIKKSQFYINNYGRLQVYDSNYKELPNYHIDNLSIYCYSTQHPYMAIWPEEVAAECNKVFNSLEKIFNKYKKPNKLFHTD